MFFFLILVIIFVFVVLWCSWRRWGWIGKLGDEFWDCVDVRLLNLWELVLSII